MKLVIADDSPMMRERIKNMVMGFDHVTIVGEAGNGIIALEMIGEFDPDLIILDLHMPLMGGMEVLRKIKDAMLKTKVCILTNYTYPQYKQKCLAFGADYFLNKNEDFEKLNVVIATILKEAEDDQMILINNTTI
jgi:two-component system response regulator YesN